MLNGKFYTGLPPGMIERNNANTQRNRMQSSIFWPDDTKTESAIETRVKRRNSLQIAQSERPQLRMQSSVIGIGCSGGGGDADVNTRQMFQKEFSKSSIEFLDNLCDETKARKPLLLRGNRSAAREVTPKPTALSPQLPENVVNAGYNTTAQKKQAFTSKIEFYDYAGEELNNRNLNLRRAIMDMNDKKEMERNTKNSPKLQVKNNMRNLGANEKLYPTELTRGRSGKEREIEKPKFRNDIETTVRNNMREDVEEREPERYVGRRDLDEECEDAQVERKSVRPPANRATDQRLRDTDYLESRRTVSPEYDYRREQRLRDVYEDDCEVPDFAPTTKRYGVPVRRANSVGRFTSPPKRILKHTTIRERRYHDDYPNDGYRSAEGSRARESYRNDRDHELYDHKEYNEPLNADEDYIEGRMRNIRIRTSPQKHVTYSDDTYSPHEDEMSNQSRNRALPNMRRTGSNQQRQRQQQQQQPESLRRYNSEIDLMEDVGGNERAMEETFMENDIHDNDAATTTTTTIKKLNIADSSSNYNNNINNNNNNSRNGKSQRAENVVNKTSSYSNNKNINTSRLNNQTIASAARKITPKITAISARQNTDDIAASEAVGGSGGMRKHLRSSLCLHNGEIVASDDGGGETSAAPTRNARSMATRQRISVGLPD